MKKYIAVDLGASSGRVLVGDMQAHEIVNRFETKKIFKKGSIFWDIDFIFSEICLGIRKAVELYPGQIGSIGIDTWGVDYCLLNSNDELLDLPYCYRDDRTLRSRDEIHKRMSEEDLYRMTGIQLIQFNTIYQLKADSMDRPDLLSQAESLLFIPDYLNFLLCGKKGNELTEASTSALLDPHSQKWNTALMEKFDLPVNIFHDIVQPGTVLGSLRQDIAGEAGTGIKVITIGSHDTASAVASVPVPDSRKNLFISSGTWSLLGIESDSPIITDFTYGNNFTNEVCVDGRIRLIKNIMGMWLLQETRKSFLAAGRSYTWDELSDAAEKTPPPALRLDPNDDLFFAPHTEQNPMDSRIREWYRKNGGVIPKSTGEIVKAIFDGLAGTYATYIRNFEALSGIEYDCLYIVGGGSRDMYLCQLTADYSGKKVVAGPKEATALGNLLVQAVADGSVRDYDEGRDILSRMDELVLYSPRK